MHNENYTVQLVVINDSYNAISTIAIIFCYNFQYAHKSLSNSNKLTYILRKAININAFNKQACKVDKYNKFFVTIQQKPACV